MLFRELLRSRGVLFLDTSSRDKHVRAGWLQLQCPFCGTGKWHLGYNESLNYFNCYACGWHSAYDVLRELFPCDDIRLLLSQLGVIRLQRAAAIDKRLVIPEGVGGLLPAHCDYLTSRSIDIEFVLRYGVGGIGHDPVRPYMQWRLFIPVYDVRGNIVTWTTRAVGKSIPAYLSASKEQELVSIKSMLYGEHLVTYYDVVFIVEGVFDAWRIGSQALATFGKSVTVEQKRKIARYAKRIICFDNEPDTQEQAKKLCKELSLFPGTTVNVCLDAPDPADATDNEIKRLRNIFLK
ncbi:MAG: hypothetical protein LBP59_10425 [Planctomycetaceae bacterium]|jgi:hypothetical protein|nr:hypothetical protein [Planctomycetaceae bacterium]